MEEKRSTEGVKPTWARQAAWRSLVSCAHQGTLLGSFFIPKILNYSKTDKKYFCRFFGVCLLTVPRRDPLFSFLAISGQIYRARHHGFLLLQPHGRRCLADEDRDDAGGAYRHHQRRIEYRVWALPLASAKLGGGARYRIIPLSFFFYLS